MATRHTRRRQVLGAGWCALLLGARVAVADAPLAAVPDAATPDAALLDVATPAAQVQQAIVGAVAAIPAHAEARRRYRLAFPFGAPLFPPDADFAVPAPAPGLAAWLALPAAQRRHDVLIVPDADYYWEAEGRRYSCQFVVHVTPRGGGGTHLVLLQVRPTVYAGKRFELFGRTGPGRYLDLRPAVPSAQSGADLRAFLAAALAPGQ